MNFTVPTKNDFWWNDFLTIKVGN